MRRLAPLLALTLALAIPAVALAARQPTRAERAAITRVLNRPGVPTACFPLRIKVSTRNARYAAAEYRAVDSCGVMMGNGVTIVKRIAPRRWRTVETGSDLACDGDGRVPAAVMKDLIGARCAP
jgi:hypothetical protein